MTDDTIPTTTEPATLPASILSALAELDEKRATMLALAPVTGEAEAIAAMHGGKARPDACNVAAWIDITITDMDQVASIRRALVDAGWRMNYKSERADERYFTIHHAKDGVHGIIILCVSACGGEGVTCRYVQTGTKTVPVMELRCEGAAP